MSNHKKIASIAFTGAAATAATMMAAAPALAAGSPYTIKNGGALYHGVVKGKNSGNTILKDKTKNTTLTCKKAFASGSISNGKSHGTTVATVGKVKATTTKWSSCTGPFGLTFKGHLTTSPNIILSTANAAGGTGKLSRNKISGKISATALSGLCTVTISGTSIPWKYVNARHLFNVNSASKATLRVKSVTNCEGAFAAGDSAYFRGIYIVSVPPDLTIS